MSRKNAAPTHGWIIFSTVTKWITALFFFLMFIVVLTYARISYAIDRDCNNPYWRELKIGHYWVTIKAGSTQKGCKQ